MITTMQTDRDYQRARDVCRKAARALYEAELALHDARQTRVDKWIQAASDHLHEALARHLAAERAVAAFTRPNVAA